MTKCAQERWVVRRKGSRRGRQHKKTAVARRAIICRSTGGIQKCHRVGRSLVAEIQSRVTSFWMMEVPRGSSANPAARYGFIYCTVLSLSASPHKEFEVKMAFRHISFSTRQVMDWVAISLPWARLQETKHYDALGARRSLSGYIPCCPSFSLLCSEVSRDMKDQIHHFS